MQPVTHQNGGAKPVAKPPSRMTLDNVVRGRLAKPLRVLLFGVEGVGKSTFASCAPSPIFLGTEDGTSELDVARFPDPSSMADVYDAISTLTTEQHNHQTLVIDTLDWLEPVLWRRVCEVASQPDIESFGFGKGYIAALDEWRVLLSKLDRMRAAKGMQIIMLAHSWIKPFMNPSGENYDRYELKLHAKTGGLIKEWCDAVLFANYETFAVKKSKTERAKATDTGARIIHTQRRAAWDAKNRFDLPEELPLDWDAFADAVAAHRPASPAHTRARIEAMLTELSNETVSTKVLASVVRAADDAAELARIADKLSGLLQTSEVQS
jgi:hypothetical protein